MLIPDLNYSPINAVLWFSCIGLLCHNHGPKKLDKHGLLKPVLYIRTLDAISCPVIMVRIRHIGPLLNTEATLPTERQETCRSIWPLTLKRLIVLPSDGWGPIRQIFSSQIKSFLLVHGAVWSTEQYGKLYRRLTLRKRWIDNGTAVGWMRLIEEDEWQLAKQIWSSWLSVRRSQATRR